MLEITRVLALALLLIGCRQPNGSGRATPGTPDTVAATLVDSLTLQAAMQRADAGRIQGRRDAAVWLVEVSDFQCPFCKRWHDDTYPALQREFVQTGQIRMAYVNYPLHQHAHAVAAAEAALCASEQDRFWPMHDALFATQQRWAALADAAPLFDSLAVAAGVNATQWRECVSARMMRELIETDRSRAMEAGVRSTPTFFIGEERIMGAEPVEVFRAAIQRALAKAAGRTP